MITDTTIIYGIGMVSVGLYLTCHELETRRNSISFFDDWRLWISLSILTIGIMVVIASILM